MITPLNFNNFVSESFLDYPDNSSLSLIFYMPGCNRNCKDCQNKDLQNFEGFRDIDIITSSLYELSLSYKTNKLCLQGGDPLYKENLYFTKYLLSKLGKLLDICIYTGADIEEVKKLKLNGFKFIKCGRFDIAKFIGSKKTNEYLQLATKNQALYDKDFNLLSKEGIFYF